MEVVSLHMAEAQNGLLFYGTKEETAILSGFHQAHPSLLPAPKSLG